MPSLIFKINFSFVCLFRSRNGNGWLIFSMLDVLFSREATSETYGPWVFFLIYLLCDLFYLHFLFKSIKPKIQKYFAALYLFTIYYFNLLQFSGIIPWKGLTTPLTHRVARCCYLSAGVVYVVLLGSLIGSITLVSSLREIPTFVVLHHPFLFGETPT